MSEWKPIETAPKDEDVDLWVVCHPKWRPPNGYAFRITDACWSHGRWVHVHIDELVDVEDENYRATHWMPVPEPPAPTCDDREGGRTHAEDA